MEIWKDIKDFEGYYQISSHGRLKSFKRDRNGRILSNKNAKGWYLSINLVRDKSHRRSVKIHKLVAEHFIPNPDGKPEVNHKDMDKQNNHVNNLEWVSRHENMKFASILNPAFLKAMKRRNRFEKPIRIQQFDSDGNFIAEYANAQIAASLTGVCGRNILQVASQAEYKPGMTRKQAGGFVWKFNTMQA